MKKKATVFFVLSIFVLAGCASTEVEGEQVTTGDALGLHEGEIVSGVVVDKFTSMGGDEGKVVGYWAVVRQLDGEVEVKLRDRKQFDYIQIEQECTFRLVEYFGKIDAGEVGCRDVKSDLAEPTEVE